MFVIICLIFISCDTTIGTCLYNIHHCLRSIHSAAASIQRHRMTTEDPRGSWEYRLKIYVFPADLEDCTFSQNPYDNTAGVTIQDTGGMSGGEGSEEREYLALHNAK